MAPKPRSNSGQQHCMSEAIELLKPQNTAERTQREKDINFFIEYWQFAVEPAPVATAKDARKRLRKIKQSATAIVEDLDRLNTLAQAVLPKSIRDMTSATLTVFAEEVEHAILNVERPKGGAEPDRKRRYLAYLCAELFERFRPGEVKPTLEGSFHNFAAYVSGIAHGTGKWDDKMGSAIEWACKLHPILGGKTIPLHGDKNLRTMGDLEAYDAAVRKIQSAADRERK